MLKSYIKLSLRNLSKHKLFSLINIGWSVGLLTLRIALLTAIFTISFQAIKAAIANPVKSLRTE